MYKYYAPCRADKRVTTVRVNCYRPCTKNAGANYSTTVVSTIPSAFDHSAASVVAVHVKREVQIHPPVKASSVFPVMLGAGDGPPSP